MKALRSDLRATGVTTMLEEDIARSSYHGERPATVERQNSVGFTAGAVRAERAQLDLEAPARCFTLDANEMPARAAVLAAGRGRGRGDADHRDRPGWAGDARHLAAMVVP